MSGPGHPAMRILLVSNMWPSGENPVYGGFVARQADALRALGADVTVVANEDSRTGVVRSMLKYRRLSRRIAEAATAGRFDAVVGHYLYPTAGMARTAARIAGARLALVVHGTDARSALRPDPYARAARRAAREADLIVAVSRALERSLRIDLNVPGTVPVSVIHMGIDDAVFRPDPDARTTLGVPDSERVVLFVGNLVPVKGLDTLEAAFGKLVADGAADRLVIVGGGPLEPDVRAWAEGDPALKDRVQVTGRLPQAEVARWMAAADVFVLPSHHEGLGLVLFEAMACGTPCVASEVGGVPEVLDEATGVMVPAGDAEALSSAITRVVASGKDAWREACLAAARGQGSVEKARELLHALQALQPNG